MKPKNWLSVLGEFELQADTVKFKGGISTLRDAQSGYHVGNFINNLEFGGGQISATIRFDVATESSAAGLMLYFHPPTQGFIEAQLGNQSLCSLQTYSGTQWTTRATYGPANQLQPNRDYHVRVKVTGSRVVMELDGIRTIDTNLGFPLPKGQTGIWAIGPNDISVSDFDVQMEDSNLFVVMQFTDPYNELYSDVIHPVAKELGFSVTRADEQTGPGLIITDIERQIVEARAVIADITPKNPNVYWEVGYAHALRKPTILIAERKTDLPFDVSPFRVLFYDNTIAGKSRIEEGLRLHLAAIEREWAAT